jgi:hypothetical protein
MRLLADLHSSLTVQLQPAAYLAVRGGGAAQASAADSTIRRPSAWLLAPGTTVLVPEQRPLLDALHPGCL